MGGRLIACELPRHGMTHSCVSPALALVITGKETVEWDETDSPSSTNNDNTFLNHKVGRSSLLLLV